MNLHGAFDLFFHFCLDSVYKEAFKSKQVLECTMLARATGHECCKNEYMISAITVLSDVHNLLCIVRSMHECAHFHQMYCSSSVLVARCFVDGAPTTTPGTTATHSFAV